MRLQKASGAQAQVVFSKRAAEAHVPVIPAPDAHAVGTVDQAKDRLQLVVAVRPLGEDVQEEVEFPGGREVAYFHSEMARRISMP